jgi:hypothetical protein
MLGRPRAVVPSMLYTGVSQANAPSTPIPNVLSYESGQFVRPEPLIFGTKHSPNQTTLPTRPTRKRRGRPALSGTFQSRKEFIDRTLEAIRKVESRGDYPSQSRVLAAMGLGRSDPSRIRDWCRKLSIDWDELKRLA